MATKPQPTRPRRTVKVIRPFFASGRTIRPGEVVSLTDETAAAKVRSHKAEYIDEPKAAQEGENKSAPQTQAQTKASGRSRKRSK